MQDVLLSLTNNQPTNPANGNGRSSFLDLIEAYDFPQPKEGDIIQGEILRIDEDAVFINIGSKRDAMVPQQEIKQLDEAFLETLSAGDTVPVYVTRTPAGSEQLIVSLERGLQELDWKRAADLYAKDEIIELEVVNYNKGGLVVEFGRIQGFVPNSHLPAIQNVYSHDAQTSYKSKAVGSSLHLKIIELDPQNERFVLSAKSAQDEQRSEQLGTLTVGTKLTGKIVNLKHYGAFVDIGNGIVGLLHISHMAWEHVAHPGGLFAVGDEVDVIIDKIDVEKGKVSLNRKILLTSPWETFAQDWSAGDLLEGEVTAVVDFGAFVRVADGVEGLLHKNEMTLPNDTAPADTLSEGDIILVRLVQIDADHERLSLSTRRVTATEEISWMQAKGEVEAAAEAGASQIDVENDMIANETPAPEEQTLDSEKMEEEDVE